MGFGETGFGDPNVHIHTYTHMHAHACKHRDTVRHAQMHVQKAETSLSDTNLIKKNPFDWLTSCAPSLGRAILNTCHPSTPV